MKLMTLETSEVLMEAHPDEDGDGVTWVLVPSLSMMRPAKRKPTP